MTQYLSNYNINNTALPEVDVVDDLNVLLYSKLTFRFISI